VSGGGADRAALEERLTEIVMASPRLTRVLRCARAQALPDWMIASGAIYQTVWNALTGRTCDYGIRDYDLFYFDAADRSYEGEDRVIRAVAAALPAGLRPLVEVRNQARVHLWFEQKFGESYEPLGSSSEALTRFVSRANAVAVRLDPGDSLHIEAPFGLEDLFAMRIRPNPLRPRARAFDDVAASMKARWPEVRIEP
jgi:hypothetical protein